MSDELREILNTEGKKDIRRKIVELMLQVQRADGSNESEHHQLIASAFRRVGALPPDAEWCQWVVQLAGSYRRVLRQRAIYWDLDTLPCQAPELIDTTLAALRRRLIADDSRVSVLARGRCLAFGTLSGLNERSISRTPWRTLTW